MPAYTTADIRNILLAGHAGCGKTTLTETLLHIAGVIGKTGSIESGDTVCDFTDEEKHHRHSLFNAVVSADHQGKHLNLIDSPGSPDFLGQAITSFPAVETVAVVVSASAGIESATRRLFNLAGERNLARWIIINKIDAENINLPELVEQIRETFGAQCLPINLPTDGGKAVVNVFANTEGGADFSDVASAHTALIEQCVEVDEEIALAYLDGQEIEQQQLHAVFEKALREGHLVPICFVAARPHLAHDQPVGTSELLDLLASLAPSPLEGNPRPFIKAGDNEHEIHASAKAEDPILAHVFNVRVDPFVGKLSVFRVHQGTVSKDSQLFIGDPTRGESRKPFKVGHLFKLRGKEHVEIDAAIAGDIAAVAKVDEIHQDAVLHDSHDQDELRLRPLGLPVPMQGLAISPRKRGDEQKIADALTKLAEEDPSFKITRDSVTKETVIRGMGELHLRVVLERLKNLYHVEVDTKLPKIAYRETITTKAEGHHRHKKQTGGAGQFGEVYLRVEPMERGSGFEFADDTFGGSVPQQFIPAIEKGVRQVLEEGAIAGYPIHDVKVSVYDGKHHPVDSKEVAFVTAGKRAFIDAVSKAKPALLEPIVTIEVTVPNQHMGDITGDLSGKRGRIQGTDMLAGDMAVIKALVPLSEVVNYQSQLKSVTGGQGSFTMELSHYDPMPSHVQQQIVAEYKPRSSDD
ncbi:MAG: elongation factor G [Phycisphaeraceae bacterium]|nr:elongation factor G [Phycisphaeraceae bacterium]